ncbi:MAG: ribonuclease P protein component [Oscillospiraceae bacterium]|nr:ribonuclease P protein component [Oscillospiraceae bacterium]
MSSYVTLNLNSDFRRAYARGKVYTSPALVIYILRNRAGICRIGITASKKIGNAVQRNRARRVIRAAAEMLPELQSGYDIVFVARTKTIQKKSTEINKSMERLLRTAGVIKEDEK